MGVLSLFLGIISLLWVFIQYDFLFLYFFLVFQPILALLGMIFGIIGMKKETQKGFAVVGFMCSVVAFFMLYIFGFFSYYKVLIIG